MAGAASGAMLITTILGRIKKSFEWFKKIELAIVCFSIAFPFVILATPTYSGSSEALYLYEILFLILSFISGFLTGSQFPLANKLYLKKSSSLSQSAGVLYASDLLGGRFGGILGAVVLLPVLGLIGTCLTVGLLKLTSFTVVTSQCDRNLLGREK